MLGMSIEFFLIMLLSLILGTFVYTFFIMIFSLALRISIGGNHCTSYLRCMIFTSICFLGLSLLVKMTFSYNLFFIYFPLLIISAFIFPKPKKPAIIMLVLVGLFIIDKTYFASAIAGIFIQGFLSLNIGGKIIIFSDNLLKKIKVP